MANAHFPHQIPTTVSLPVEIRPLASVDTVSLLVRPRDDDMHTAAVFDMSPTEALRVAIGILQRLEDI